MTGRPRVAEWPASVRRRDGRVVPFDLARIERAVVRAAREVGHRDRGAPGVLARSVADALARRPRGAMPTVEEIQDLVEERLVAAGMDDVARAYIIYRQQRAELRAAKALKGVRDDLKLGVAAVTVLTSLGDDDLSALGVPGPVSDVVRRMAVLAVAAGARGLVCSPQEVAAVRAEVGPDVMLITPGVRPPGADLHDQTRVATPEEAIRAGADLLVIGRPITGASDPGAAAAAVAASIRRAVPGPVVG